MSVPTTSGRYSDYYNEEGYKDPTAYKAMKGYNVNNEWVRGDIVEIETNTGYLNEYVLISCHEEYATGLLLKDEPNKENDHNVMSRTAKHCDVGKLTPCYYNRINKLVKSMDDGAFNTLLARVAQCLGTELKANSDPVVKVVTKEVKVDDPRARAEQEIKIAKIEAERDVYKELYMQLLKGDMV